MITQRPRSSLKLIPSLILPPTTLKRKAPRGEDLEKPKITELIFSKISKSLVAFNTWQLCRNLSRSRPFHPISAVPWKRKGLYINPYSSDSNSFFLPKYPFLSIQLFEAGFCGLFKVWNDSGFVIVWREKDDHSTGNHVGCVWKGSEEEFGRKNEHNQIIECIFTYL